MKLVTVKPNEEMACESVLVKTDPFRREETCLHEGFKVSSYQEITDIA